MTLACAANAGGTCLIVIVEKDRVILASDGLELHRGAAPKTTCKIAAGPYAAIAIRGLTANAITGLDLPAMARNTVDAAEDGETAAAALADEAGQALQQELDMERSRAPGIYLERLGRPLAHVIFAWLERGRAVAIFQRYSTDANGEVERHRPERVTTESAPRMFVFCDVAAEYMRNTPELRKMDPVKLAETLLRYAIDREPKGHETVGPPIAILAVRKSGPRWIEPGACQAQSAGANR